MANPNEFCFISECYIDTNLVETLLGERANHQNGCNNVARRMKDKYDDGFAVGIIDDDKRKLSYVNEAEDLEEFWGQLRVDSATLIKVW